MLFPIFFAIPLALYADVPMLPVVVLCALCQSAIAYVLTRKALCLNAGISVAMVGIGSFVLVPLLATGTAATISPKTWSFFTSATTVLTWISAVMALISTTIIGLLGRHAGADPQQGPTSSGMPMSSASHKRSSTSSAAGSAPQDDSENFGLSFGVGAVTGNAAAGYAAGGSISGAILGSEVGSHEPTSWSSSSDGGGGAGSSGGGISD